MITIHEAFSCKMERRHKEAGSHTTLRSFRASVRSRKSSETTSLTFRKECISLFLAAFALPPRFEQKSTSLTSSGTRYASTESKLALMSFKTSDRSETSRHTRFTTNFPVERRNDSSQLSSKAYK